MAKRKYIDWDSIEPLYRAGSLSNCDICRQYEADHKNSQTWRLTVSEAAIRKHAKAKGWKKNLAQKVKEQVRENLVRSEVRDSNQSHQGQSDQEIIEQAAEAGSGVVLRHRKEINSLATVESKLLLELETLPKAGKVTLKDKSIILKNITHVRAQRIVLERQAYNLDDENNNDAPSKIIITRKTRDCEE